MKSSESTEPSGQWPGGMNNVASEFDLGNRFLREAVNVDISNSGKPRRRRGASKILDGKFHSLFDLIEWPYIFCVKDGAVTAMQVEEDAGDPIIGAVTSLVDVDPLLPMSFTEHIGRLYFSNGAQRGWIDPFLKLHLWGIPAPEADFTLSVAPGGGLPPGNYQVCLSTLMLDGEESAPSDVVNITLPADGCIAISGIKTPPAGARAIRVYRSQPNGDILYWVRDLPTMATNTVLSNDGNLGKMQEWRDAYPVQPGLNLRSHAARIYWIDGDRVGYTLPLAPSLTDPASCYYWMSGAVTLMEPVEGGIFIGTDAGVWFAAGREPKQADLRQVWSRGAVPGTAKLVPGTAFGEASPVVVFWDTNGVFCKAGIGQGFGSVTGITEGKLTTPAYDRGATLYRELDGIKQVISTMNRSGAQSSFAARDVATAEVIRNGVMVN